MLGTTGDIAYALLDLVAPCSNLGRWKVYGGIRGKLTAGYVPEHEARIGVRIVR
jgi:hypothetical protein